ncbi:MAG: hypothetical protein RIS76_1760 [Verrucomicrobiota bacterium]
MRTSMSIRVVLVEARTLLSLGLRAGLTDMPAVTLAGHTSDPARAGVEMGVQAPEVVVVDESIGWPALDELLRQVDALDEPAKVLVVAGNPTGAGALRALRAGAAGYLPATCDTDALAKAILAVSAGELVFRADQVAEMLGPFRPASGGVRDPVTALTKREREIFLLTGRGFEAKEIGRRLGVTPRTVDVHRANVRNKLDISGAHELMRYAMHWEENERLANQMRAFCRERRPLLLVEDDEVDVLSVKRALKELRAEAPVTVVANGEEALVHLRKKGTQRPFLILLDINLPRMNGREFLAELRRDPDLAPLPVVVLTSSLHESDKDDIYPLGVTGYFAKPTTSREFMQLFRSLAQYWGSNARPASALAAAV